MKAPIGKWLAYTVLVGLLPVLVRLLIWAIVRNGAVDAFAAPDFITFGLVLHISIVNELEHLKRRTDWKAIQNGTCLVFIAIYGALYATMVISQNNSGLVNSDAALRSSIVMATVSFLFSLSVFYRLSKLN